MKRLMICLVALLLVPAAFPAPALAQGLGGGVPRVALPFDLVDYLDGVKFKIRVPANWNGTLLGYMQSTKIGTPPAEPLVVPKVIGPTEPSLEATLLTAGYALAASEVGTADMQPKEEVQDTFALTTYFRGRVGDPKRVILWGSSVGGLTAVRLIEDFPRSFDAAIPMCWAAAGYPRRFDRFLDVALAYAVVFGWPSEWGTLEDLREGLLMGQDVVPKVKWPAADGSNRGGWEFIRLVSGLESETFWGTDPLSNYPGYFVAILAATWQRERMESYASGPVTQNLGRRYALKPDEKVYLAGLGVNADELLAKMNARADIAANPRARAYFERFGDVRGLLRRPVLTLHNRFDCAVEVSQESAYRAAVESWGTTEYLVQTYVAGVGHCAFTSRQLLAALAAIENWLDTGVKPDASFFPETEGFDNSFVPPPFPY